MESNQCAVVYLNYDDIRVKEKDLLQKESD